MKAASGIMRWGEAALVESVAVAALVFFVTGGWSSPDAADEAGGAMQPGPTVVWPAEEDSQDTAEASHIDQRNRFTRARLEVAGRKLVSLVEGEMQKIEDALVRR